MDFKEKLQNQNGIFLHKLIERKNVNGILQIYIFWKDPNIYENYLFQKTANISKSKVNIFDTNHKNARLKDSTVFQIFRFEYKEKERITSLAQTLKVVLHTLNCTHTILDFYLPWQVVRVVNVTSVGHHHIETGMDPGRNEILSSLKLCSSSIAYMRVAMISNLRREGGIGMKGTLKMGWILDRNALLFFNNIYEFKFLGGRGVVGAGGRQDRGTREIPFNFNGSWAEMKFSPL